MNDKAKYAKDPNDEMSLYIYWNDYSKQWNICDPTDAMPLAYTSNDLIGQYQLAGWAL